MSKATYSMPVIISTIGQADLNEYIDFKSNQKILVGDLIDLKVSKPADAPTYGIARVTQYLNWNGGNPTKFRAIRIQ